MMRKLIFSSKLNEFEGSFFLVYNQDGFIQEINFNDVSLTSDKRNWIKKNSPPVWDLKELENFIIATRTEAIESTIVYNFEDFWLAYGKKINKKRCLPLWNKLSDSKKSKAVNGINKYNSFLAKEAWRTKADPENYLRNEMWENEWK